MMEIYRASVKIFEGHPSDSDEVVKKVMGENTLTLTFSLSEPFDFHVGDYCFFSGERYTLNILPKVDKASERELTYTLLMEGLEYELRKVQHLFYTANLSYIGGSDFSLMGNAELHARVIVENLNRVQSGWTLGVFPSTDVKNLTFSSNNCTEAITKIAEAFETEYWVGSDKTINIGKRGDSLAVTFEYGMNKGLYEIERDNVSTKDIVTRLYPFGSESNLPKGYRSNAKRLQISTSYIEKNVTAYGVIESSQIFDSIKPERTGTITGVGDIFTFSDSSMDFDLSESINGTTTYLIPSTSAKIHFQTGDLAGYEFELLSYNHATKTFVIKEFTNEVAYNLPNSTLKPKVGDTYVIIDIYMPQSYVDAAEARLLAKAQESIDQNSVPNVSYSVKVDSLFVKRNSLTFRAGDYVGVKDTQLGIDRTIRITSIKRKINKPNNYDLELSDSVEPSLADQIITTLEQTDYIIKMNRLNDPARAKRAWKTTQELHDAIYDQDGYFDNGNIKPFSIETAMLSVGSKGQQFYTDCYFQANYGGNKNTVSVGSGSLAHFTIEESIRAWTVASYSETLTDDNLRYIYIRCQKVGSGAIVALSTQQLAIEDSTYYNFFAGVLSSVIDNARQISLLFGFTSINGRFIKTGRIQNGDGSRYWDVDSGEFKGKATFESGSSGYGNITDKPDLSVYSLQSYVNSVTSNLQNQIDGQIMTWFDTYVPTLSNAPVTSWTTDADKDKHLGDLFYNKTTGLGYRFSKTGSVYSWELLKDTDVATALANAAKAQDTADGKRRVFTAQPSNSDAYDVGDLWANATYGSYTNELLKCKTAKAAGVAFDIAHWEKASKYTDDTALDYLKTALQGSTDISGGLLATNVLLMKTLAGVITGGMSGLSDDNTGFWTGGTYADAINAVANIILRKDGSGQLAGGKILWDLFGALSVGNFKIDGGAIVGYDSSLRERVKLHNGALNTLSELTNSWARQSARWKWFSVRTTQYVNETSSSQTITRVFTTFDSVSLPYANMQLRLSKGAHSITSTGGTVQSSSYLFKIYNSSNQLVTTDAGNLGTIQLANAGTYSITLEVTVSVVVPAGASEYTKINTTTNGYCDVYQSVARTEISSDGFMSYWTNALYLYFSQSAGLTYKGSMNIPGVLAAASVAAGGGSANAWGAKVGSSSWKSTGTYTINHSVEHNNYTVQITPRAASRIGYVSGTPGSSSFTIVMTNMSGTPVDAAFDYEIIGSN